VASKIRVEIFSVNNRNNLIPNLWCICAVRLNPIIYDITDQFVAFNVIEHDKSFGIVAVYASTSYIKRRQLWNDLTNLQNSFNLPWCYFGDFNTILEASEHRGRVAPARLSMSDFQPWTSINDLLHLPTRGVLYTWHNGRLGRGLD